MAKPPYLWPAPPCAFVAKPVRPKLYRYLVADHGLRFTRNRYHGEFGSATIGAAMVVGRYAYCLMWADAKVRFP